MALSTRFRLLPVVAGTLIVAGCGGGGGATEQSGSGHDGAVETGASGGSDGAAGEPDAGMPSDNDGAVAMDDAEGAGEAAAADGAAATDATVEDGGTVNDAAKDTGADGRAAGGEGGSDAASAETGAGPSGDGGDAASASDAGAGDATTPDATTGSGGGDAGLDSTTGTYSLGGGVSGLANGASVVLGDGTSTTTVTGGAGSSVSFSFPTAISSGTGYTVGVQTQPTSPSQTCTVNANGSGTMGGSNLSNVGVTCTTNTYSVGGTVTGLTSLGLVLQDNNADNMPIGADGSFTFPTMVASGSPYAVTIQAQPTSPAQTCTVSVSGSSGTVTTGNVSAVQVNCQTNTYTVGGGVTGLAGTVVLQDNGANNLSVTTSSFAFPPAASGSVYNVTVLSQPSSPSQTCTVTSGVGLIASTDVSTVSVGCTTNSFTVGGTLSGLDVPGTVVLSDNVTDFVSLTQNGSFTFPTSVLSGKTYAATVTTEPTPGVTCSVTPATAGGTVGASNVISVAVTCSTTTSCLAYLKANPGAASGTYMIDPDGPGGPVSPFQAYCDMTFDDGNGDVGGWTLIEATWNGQGPSGLTGGVVLPGTATYMPSSAMQALATISAQVHIRSPGSAATASVTSVASGTAIANLRQLAIVDQLSDPTPEYTNWFGPNADDDHLDFSCDTSGQGYPSIYWACGNGDGTHIVGTNSRWHWDGGDTTQNTSMEVYVR